MNIKKYLEMAANEDMRARFCEHLGRIARRDRNTEAAERYADEERFWWGRAKSHYLVAGAAASVHRL